jgi:hypothetical protein
MMARTHTSRTEEGRRGRTGPRTPAGKTRSSRNALRHGLSARSDTPQSLARHAEEAHVLLSEIMGHLSGAPVPPDDVPARLSSLGERGRVALASTLAFVAADERVRRARLAKRDALLAAQGLLRCDTLLDESYADLVEALNHYAPDGADPDAAAMVAATRAVETLAALSRSVPSRPRRRPSPGTTPFGAPANRSRIESLGLEGAALLSALREIARLDRYEARAFGERRKATRRMRLVVLLLTPVPPDDDDVEDEASAVDATVDGATQHGGRP